MGRKVERSLIVKREKERKRLDKLEMLLRTMQKYEPELEIHNGVIIKKDGKTTSFMCYYGEKTMKQWLEKRMVGE